MEQRGKHSSYPRPPRNWRRYWWCYLGHALLGALAGWLTGSHQGWGILMIYLAYQTLEWLRMRDGKGDTPGRDIADFGVGYVVVVLLRLLLPL